MKTKIILFFALLMPVVSYYYFRNQEKNEIARSERVLHDLQNQIRSQKDEIGLNEVTWIDNGIILPDSVKALLTHHNGLGVHNKKVLVIRYSELNCNTCVEKFIQATKELASADKPVLLMVDYRNEAYLNTFIRLNKIKYPIIKVSSQLLGLEADKLNVPYAFIVDEKYRVDHLFFPMLENQHNSKLYLTTMIKRYFSHG